MTVGEGILVNRVLKKSRNSAKSTNFLEEFLNLPQKGFPQNFSTGCGKAQEKSAVSVENSSSRGSKSLEKRDSAYLSVDNAVDTVENFCGKENVEKSKEGVTVAERRRLCQLTKSTKMVFLLKFSG